MSDTRLVSLSIEVPAEQAEERATELCRVTGLAVAIETPREPQSRYGWLVAMCLIAVQQFSISDRIEILRALWKETVWPALRTDAERRALELETFPVPFPSTVGREP